MKEKIQISGGLFACFISLYMHAAQVLFLPNQIIREAGQEGWIAVLLGELFGLLVGWLAVWVALRHPDKSPIALARALLGKWLGSFVMLFYVAFALWLFSLVLRDILDFSVIVLLPRTPGRVIVSLMALVALYGAWNGLESIMRVAFQVLVAVGLSLLAMPILLAPEFNQLQVSPFLERGLSGVLRGVIPGLSWWAEIFLIMTLVPRLKRPRDAYRWTAVGVAGAALMLGHLVLLTSLVFGPVLPGRFMFPVYNLVQMVSVAQIIERIEMVMITVWLSNMYIKVAFCLYVASEGAAELLGLKTQRWPAVVFAVAGVLLTQVWPGTFSIIAYGMSGMHNLFHLSVQLGVPMVLALAWGIRRFFRKGEATHV